MPLKQTAPGASATFYGNYNVDPGGQPVDPHPTSGEESKERKETSFTQSGARATAIFHGDYNDVHGNQRADSTPTSGKESKETSFTQSGAGATATFYGKYRGGEFTQDRGTMEFHSPSPHKRPKQTEEQFGANTNDSGTKRPGVNHESDTFQRQDAPVDRKQSSEMGGNITDNDKRDDASNNPSACGGAPGSTTINSNHVDAFNDTNDDAYGSDYTLESSEESADEYTSPNGGDGRNSRKKRHRDSPSEDEASATTPAPHTETRGRSKKVCMRSPGSQQSVIGGEEEVSGRAWEEQFEDALLDTIGGPDDLFAPHERRAIDANSIGPGDATTSANSTVTSDDHNASSVDMIESHEYIHIGDVSFSSGQPGGVVNFDGTTWHSYPESEGGNTRNWVANGSNGGVITMDIRDDWLWIPE